MKDRTSIAVTPETRRILAAFGRKGESYEDILRRLIDKQPIKPESMNEPEKPSSINPDLTENPEEEQ